MNEPRPNRARLAEYYGVRRDSGKISDAVESKQGHQREEKSASPVSTASSIPELKEKPVISTNVGGIPELMKDGETGFLIKKDSPEELFEKLSMLLNNLEEAKKMGRKGKEFVKNNFNWDKICNDFLNHLKKHSIGDI